MAFFQLLLEHGSLSDTDIDSHIVRFLVFFSVVHIKPILCQHGLVGFISAVPIPSFHLPCLVSVALVVCPKLLPLFLFLMIEPLEVSEDIPLLASSTETEVASESVPLLGSSAVGGEPYIF